MGFFESIFGRKKESQKQLAAETFRFLRGYTPVFQDAAGEIYESMLIRAALDAHARHAKKLKPVIEGSAKPYLQSRLKIQPNAWQTWPQWLARHVTILYARNTVFTVPVRGEYDEINGIIDIVPERWELVDYHGDPWLRFYFDRGKRAAVSLYEVGIQTRFQLKNELFGENQDAIRGTLDLIELQRQGISEGIKNGATYRFYATHNNFVQDKDLQKERKRFDEMNFSKNARGGGVLLFPNTYKDIHQATNTAYAVNAEQEALIKNNVFDYFAVNEDILQNKAFGDAWLAFYEGATEAFAIDTSESLTRMLYSERERTFDNKLFFTSNRLQYMSNKDKLEAIKTNADRGLMTRNELREILNLSPLPEPLGSQIPARGEYYNVGADDTGDDDDAKEAGENAGES